MDPLVAVLVSLLFFCRGVSVDAQGCGGSLSGAYGQFRSENYPNPYPEVQRNCTWNLVGLPGSIIQLEFLDFDLEPVGLYSGYNYTSCQFDFVIVHDPVQGTTWPDYCGNTIPPVIRGSSNVLTVTFGSDNQDSFRGFEAEFVSNPCPDALNDCDHICVENQGTKVCLCYPGYHLNADGKTCDDLDECVTRSHNCSQTCINQPGSYTCSCNPGYRLMADGRSCADIDECSENPDICDQRCYNLPGAYACGCDPGYTLTADESACEIVTESSGEEVTENTDAVSKGGYDRNLVLGLAIALAVSLLFLLLLLVHVCCARRCQWAKHAKNRTPRKDPPQRRGSKVDTTPTQPQPYTVRVQRYWPGTPPDQLTSNGFKPAPPFHHHRRFNELPALSVH